MRPPKCCICGASPKNSEMSFKLVRFKLTEEQKRKKKEMKEKRWVGHPPGVEWFCENHYIKARELNHLTLQEAIEILAPK